MSQKALDSSGTPEGLNEVLKDDFLHHRSKDWSYTYAVGMFNIFVMCWLYTYVNYFLPSMFIYGGYKQEYATVLALYYMFAVLFGSGFNRKIFQRNPV